MGCALLILLISSTSVIVSGAQLVQEGKSNKVTTLDDMKVLSRSKRTITNGLSSAEQTASVDKHNALRSGENAADIKFMQWNNYLADMAQEWAQGCSFAHGQPSRDTNTMPYQSLGQNLFFTTGGFNVDGAIQAWFDEKPDYNYDGPSCTAGRMCGHYTQVVWASSYEVGCGMHVCPTLTDPDNGATYSNAKYYVCNYGPPGNYAGQKPYKKGAVCTKCASGEGWCYNNLCRSNCAGSGVTCECRASCLNCGTKDSSTCSCTCKAGWTGPDCSTQCVDTHSNCGANPGWPASTCSSYDFVRNNCPALCGICTPDDGVPCTATPPPTQGPVTTSGAGGDTQPPATTALTGINGCANYNCNGRGTAEPFQSSCRCRCDDGWQGDRCQHNKEEHRFGVIFRIQTPLNTWTDIWRTVRPMVAAAVTNICHLEQFYGLCCPDSGDRKGSDTWDYVTENDLTVGQGYPEEIPPNIQSLIFVQVDLGNNLCTRGGSVSSRRKRDLTRAMSRDKRATTTVKLSQEVLYEAVNSISSNLSTAMNSCCSAKLVSIVKAEVETSSDAPGGLPMWAIVVIVIAAVALLIAVVAVVAVVVMKKSSSKVTSTDQQEAPPTKTTSSGARVVMVPVKDNFGKAA